MNSDYRKGIFLFSIATAVATFILICAGALVTGTGSGLSVPDWPLSFGQFFPEMKGGVFFEHGHRMIAGTVGILMFVLMIWIQIQEKRKGVRLLAILAFVSVLVQAVLGGLTVIYRLPPAISIAHAALAQLFFCLTLLLAVLTSRSWIENDSQISASYLSKSALMVTFIIYFQIFLGALYRHSGLGLAYHVIGAFAVLLSIMGLCIRIIKNEECPKLLRLLSNKLSIMMLLQLVLGFSALVAKMRYAGEPHLSGVIFTTAHIALGTGMLATSVILTLWAHRYMLPQNEHSMVEVST